MPIILDYLARPSIDNLVDLAEATANQISGSYCLVSFHHYNGHPALRRAGKPPTQETLRQLKVLFLEWHKQLQCWNLPGYAWMCLLVYVGLNGRDGGVAALQTVLNSLVDIEIDGILGKETRSAINGLEGNREDAFRNQLQFQTSQRMGNIKLETEVKA